MPADIIQIRDYQNKRDLERMAVEVMNQCFPSYPGGIDDLIDTAPCEYVAPEKDPA
jgi:hypothetical protein